MRPQTLTREDEMIAAYREMPASRIESRPCVCGAPVFADPTAPARGVAAHQFTSRHKAWRVARDFDEPYPGAVE